MHVPTYEFTNDLFVHYVEEPPVKPCMIIGSYLPLLDDVRKEVHREWREFFGTDLPDSIVYQEYANPSDENEELEVICHMIGESITKKLGYEHADGYRGLVGWESYKIQREVFESTVDFQNSEPRMQLTVPLLPGFPVRNTQNQKDSISRSLDCVITAFGMNAMRLLEPRGLRPEEFDSNTARTVINELGRKTAHYDLPWLLGSLGTQFVQSEYGQTIRTVVTVGADFSEIEKKVLAPIASKDPEVLFVLNAVLASDHTRRANHALNIVGVSPSGNFVNVLDPKVKGVRRIPVDDFWDRWVQTNMQAVVAVVQPQSLSWTQELHAEDLELAALSS